MERADLETTDRRERRLRCMEKCCSPWHEQPERMQAGTPDWLHSHTTALVRSNGRCPRRRAFALCCPCCPWRPCWYVWSTVPGHGEAQGSPPGPAAARAMLISKLPLKAIQMSMVCEATLMWSALLLRDHVWVCGWHCRSQGLCTGGHPDICGLCGWNLCGWLWAVLPPGPC